MTFLSYTAADTGNLSRAHKAADVLVYGICTVLLTALIVLCFNPGYMNLDCVDHWQQAHTHHYRDWHPVMLTLLWSQLFRLYDGSQSALVFQVLVFCVGSVFAFHRLGNRWKTSVLLILVAAFPVVFLYLGTNGEDSLLAVFLVLSVGLYYEYAAMRRERTFVFALLASFLAFSIRHNALFAVLPIIGLLFWKRFCKYTTRVRLTLATGLTLICVPIFSGVLALTNVLLHVEHDYPYQVILTFDLAALSVDGSRPQIPAEFFVPGGSLENLRSMVTPSRVDTLYWGSKPGLRMYNEPGAVHRLLSVWFDTVRHHPGAYLHWRWRVFYEFLGFDSGVWFPYVHDGVTPNGLGLKLHRTSLTLAVLNVVDRYSNSWIFRVYLYLLVLTILFGLGCWKHRIDIVLISAGALLYSLANFFITMNATFRYAASTVFLTIFLLARIWGEYSARVSEYLTPALHAIPAAQNEENPVLYQT